MDINDPGYASQSAAWEQWCPLLLAQLMSDNDVLRKRVADVILPFMHKIYPPAIPDLLEKSLAQEGPAALRQRMALLRCARSMGQDRLPIVVLRASSILKVH
jgi:hypothetical protein